MDNWKGTKGQWFPNVVRKITIGVNADINRHNGGIHSQNVCEFILSDTYEEYEKERVEIEANAKLIAAAPELLKAIQAFVIAVESEEVIMHDNLDHDGFASTPNRIFDNSKKAIEKALK